MSSRAMKSAALLLPGVAAFSGQSLPECDDSLRNFYDQNGDGVETFEDHVLKNEQRFGVSLDEYTKGDHEARFIRADADGDGKMTLEEFTKFWQQDNDCIHDEDVYKFLMQIMTDNADGSVSLKSWNSFFDEQYKQLTKGWLEDRFSGKLHRLDTDGDGVLSEYEVHVEVNDERLTHLLDGIVDKNMRKCAMMGDFLDVNLDGVETAEDHVLERQKWLKTEMDEYSTEVHEGRFAAGDTNGDGVMTLEEYAAFTIKEMNCVYPQDWYPVLFQYLINQEDDTATLDSWNSYFYALEEMMTMKDVYEHFDSKLARLDDNEDGAITPDETHANHEIHM